MRMLLLSLLLGAFVFSVPPRRDRIIIHELSATVAGDEVTVHVSGEYPHPEWGCYLGDVDVFVHENAKHFWLSQRRSAMKAPCTSTIFPLYEGDIVVLLSPGKHVIKVNNRSVRVIVP